MRVPILLSIILGAAVACGGGGTSGVADAAADSGADAPKACAGAKDCAGFPVGPCQVAACDPETGACEAVADAAKEGAACDPGDTCATGAGKCEAGQCRYPKKTCETLPCMTATCDAGTGDCVYKPVTEGSECDLDGNPCTADACSSGQCKAGANACACDDAHPCPDDGGKCNGDLECAGHLCVVKAGTVVPCVAPGPCVESTCDYKTGACTRKDRADGVTCDDEDACTSEEQCKAGECVGKPVVTNDGDPCTDDLCDPATGVSHPFNTAPCNDGDPCTVGEACKGGACAGGTPDTCDDKNPCTDDSCKAGQGCEHKANAEPCNDGDECTVDEECSGGKCTGTKLDCDDHKPCTTDTCDKVKGCQHADNTDPCEDGNPCTAGDACNGGGCVAGTRVFGCCQSGADCDDDDPCTVESCDQAAHA